MIPLYPNHFIYEDKYPHIIQPEDSSSNEDNSVILEVINRASSNDNLVKNVLQSAKKKEPKISLPLSPRSLKDVLFTPRNKLRRVHACTPNNNTNRISDHAFTRSHKIQQSAITTNSKQSLDSSTKKLLTKHKNSQQENSQISGLFQNNQSMQFLRKGMMSHKLKEYLDSHVLTSSINESTENRKEILAKIEKMLPNIQKAHKPVITLNLEQKSIKNSSRNASTKNTLQISSAKNNQSATNSFQKFQTVKSIYQSGGFKYSSVLRKNLIN